MDKQMNLRLRVVLIVVLAVAGGFYVQSDFGRGAFDGRTVGLAILALVTARFSRALLLRRKYPNLNNLKIPNFSGALWGEQQPLQAEIDIVLVAFSVGAGALVLGLLLNRALSLGGILGMVWGVGDLWAIRAFLSARRIH